MIMMDEQTILNLFDTDESIESLAKMVGGNKVEARKLVERVVLEEYMRRLREGEMLAGGER